jgi:hypothetical protein
VPLEVRGDALGSLRNLKAWIFHLRPASWTPVRNSVTTEPWADTASSTGWLMIAVLGGLADVARVLPIKVNGEGGRALTIRRMPEGDKKPDSGDASTLN